MYSHRLEQSRSYSRLHVMSFVAAEKDKIPWMMKAAEQEEDESSSGSSNKTIIVVLVIFVVVVAIAVTGYAYQKKILCFKQSDGGEEEATGESPLLKQTTSASKVSHSRTTSATTLNKSRPSGTSVSRSTTYGHR